MMVVGVRVGLMTRKRVGPSVSTPSHRTSSGQGSGGGGWAWRLHLDLTAADAGVVRVWFGLGKVRRGSG